MQSGPAIGDPASDPDGTSAATGRQASQGGTTRRWTGSDDALRALFLTACRVLDRITTWLCIAACLVLLSTILAVVVLRFGFDTGFIRLQNLAGYAFAVLMILSLPYCLRRGGHVRVEVLSERLPPAYARYADMAALVLFVVPVFGLLAWAWLPDLRYSWQIFEGAVEIGGLGGVFVIKSALPLAGLLMILQGIAVLLDPEIPKR